MIIGFKLGSLYELGDPIPYDAKYPQGLGSDQCRDEFDSDA